ncbi:MAG: hypothetical protein QW760_07660 [Thermofilaceae archaeon]
MQTAKYDHLAKYSHSDGWGLAAVSGSSVLFYKTAEKIWCDQSTKTLVEQLTPPLAAIFHVRKASKDMPLGTAAAHPYPINLSNNGILFVAQNGRIAMDVLECMLSRKLEGVVDSYAYALALAKRLEESYDLVKAVASLHNELEAANAIRMANTLALLVKPHSQVSCNMIVVRHVVDPSLLEYGELYYASDNNFFLAVSSSVAKLAEETPQCDLEPIKNNAILHLDLSNFQLTLASL